MWNDTIAAITTAAGNAAVGIVRLSGPQSHAIAERVTRRTLDHRRPTLSYFYDESETPIDQGLVLYFKAPHSFTGEDVVELQGHGGMIVLSQVLAAALAFGARAAHPGEFSKRAFLNQRIDLAQAEAISDLIHASSVQAAKSACRSLSGAFSVHVNEILQDWIALRMLVEVAIDFPEEEIDFLSHEKLQSQLGSLKQKLQKLLQQAHQGRALNSGIHVALVGAPNAGKSSLLNVLVGEERAIVTDIPGTTRDVLQEKVIISGIPFVFYDTAGIRETENIIEQEGIRRAQQVLEKADVVMALFDGSVMSFEEASDMPMPLQEHQKMIWVNNKIDLKREVSFKGISISTKTREGIEELKKELLAQCALEQLEEHTFTARTRHIDALKKAMHHLERAAQKKMGWELIAEELRCGQQCVNEITGAFTSDDLLGKIFSEFCIGK